MESDDDAAEGPTAVQLNNDMLRQLAAGMAAALATQRQTEAGGVGPSGEPDGSETDLSDGSRSEEEDSSDSEQERHSAGGASTAANGLSRAGGRPCRCCSHARSGAEAYADAYLWL